jgi:uncharacterized protein
VIDRVQDELRAAMKAGRRDRVGALRMVLAALQRAEKDAPGGMSEDDEIAVLRRERKQRMEAATAYRDAGHEERAAGEEAEATIIDEFLPAPLSDAELEALVDAAIAEAGAQGMCDMGRVMGAITARAGGRADMGRAAALVRERLQH